MTKLNFRTHPFLLGFEQLERLAERTAKSGADGYPPFNIEQASENAYRITLAVAGFDARLLGADDLLVEAEFFVGRELPLDGRAQGGGHARGDGLGSGGGGHGVDSWRNAVAGGGIRSQTARPMREPTRA